MPPDIFENIDANIFDLDDVDFLDNSFYQEFKAMYQLGQKYKECNCLLGNENLSETSKEVLIKATENYTESIGYLLSRAFTKLHNLGYRFYKKIRGMVDDARNNLYKVSTLWEQRIKRNINNIPNESLSEEEVELYPADDWINISKTVLKLFTFCNRIEEVCNDSNIDMLTNYMKEIKNNLSNIGVEVSVSRLSVDYNDLLDKRKYQSLSDLGYTKSSYPNFFRYSNEIAHWIPKDAEHNVLVKKHNDYLRQLMQEASNLKDAFNKGKLKKESAEYKSLNDKLINQMVRAGYCYCILNVAFTLSDYLIKDIFKMFSKVEDLIIEKK